MELVNASPNYWASVAWEITNNQVSWVFQRRTLSTAVLLLGSEIENYQNGFELSNTSL